MKIFQLLFICLCLTTGLFAEQKIVLISGATGGIGLATVKAFQAKGWKVWAGYRQQIPDELKNMENVRLCHLDVTDEHLILAAIEVILKEDGRIDALVNNAGYGLIGAEECVTLEEAQYLFDVNFFGSLRLIQAVAPKMRQQRSGHILNISSGAALQGLPGLGLYSASKAALESMSESLAATLSPWNIQVAIVEPGFVKNDWGKHCIIGTRPCQEELYKKLTQGVCTMVTAPQGQPCDIIASLLVEIAETPQVNLRYQTSKEMKSWAAEIWVEPTGNTKHQANLRFLHRLMGDIKSDAETP